MSSEVLLAAGFYVDAVYVRIRTTAVPSIRINTISIRTPGDKCPQVIFRLFFRQIADFASLPVKQRNVGRRRLFGLPGDRHGLTVGRELRVTLRDIVRMGQINGFTT